MKNKKMCCHYPGVGHCWHCKETDNPQIRTNCPLWGQPSASKKVPRVEPLVYDWDEIGSNMLKQTVEKINEIIERLNDED